MGRKPAFEDKIKSYSTSNFVVLDIGSTDILSEYSREIKPRNFFFSIGSDLLKNSLSYKSARNDILKILNKSNFSKDILFNIADKGFRF